MASSQARKDGFFTVASLSFDQAQAIIQRDLGPYLVAGASYPGALPADLALWYCYVVDGGHSLYVTGEADPSADPTPKGAPAPVRTVLRIGYTVRPDGWVFCSVPYDPDFGLLTEAGDDEF